MTTSSAISVKSRTTTSRSALRNLLSRTRKLWNPPPRLSISEWAELYFYLSQEGNAEPGKYHCSRMPMQRDMLNDPLDPDVSEIFWMIASQLGKTLCIVIIVGYHVDQRPSPILIVYPTIDSAKAWVKEKFTPSISATPRMKGLIRDPRSRDSENTTLNKKFPGGNLTASGANSPSGLRQRSKRVVIQDEIDAFEPNSEGDPCEQADKRAETFHDAIKLKSSTPTDKSRSRVEAGFEKSDKQYWFCPCPECGKYQNLKWCQVRWTFDQKDGSTIVDPSHAVYVCEHCQAHLTDQQRIAMILAGEWRATTPFRGIRGRHMNGIYGLIGKKKAYRSFLHQFVEDFLRAKSKGPESLKVWTNTFLAETWEDEAQEGPKPELVFARREDYEDLPSGCLVLTAGADVQADRIECEIVGFGEGEESWGIDYRVFKGNVESAALWNELDLFIQSKYRHACGAFLSPVVTCIDSGHKSKIVYSFVRRCQPRRVFAVKGVGTHGVPWVTRSRKQPVLLLKVSTAKEAIYSRANIEEPGQGYMHWNKRYDLEYFRQLFSERVVTRFRFGQPVKIFEAHGRNEALDARVYAMAALDLLRPDYKILAAQLKAAADLETNPNPKPQESPSPAAGMRGGLGRTGWKI